ncbi:DUF3592 domain-containing protein [Streptomyces sediminimaris]|uniref:DUF3592 domain-containing protein n=1 Tax=Streptomyces sediminimaris TaxID=3383721 RepID=UPI00399C16B7
MDAVFFLLPCLIMAGALLMAYRVVRRWWQIRAAWRSGLTAQGRCLRTFATAHGGGSDSPVSTTLHHVYEFTTHDGREIRFEEDNGPATRLEGDLVTVHYTDGPAVVATAHDPGRRRRAAAGAGCVLVLLGVVVVFCVGFMAVYTGVFLDNDLAGF